MGGGTDMNLETWAKPVRQPLRNQLRCKRGEGGLSSERTPGKQKKQIHDDEKTVKTSWLLSSYTVKKVQHHSLPVYITVVLHLSHSQ